MVKSAYIRAFGETATMSLCFTKLSGLWRTTGFGQEHTTMNEFSLFGHIWSLLIAFGQRLTSKLQPVGHSMRILVSIGHERLCSRISEWFFECRGQGNVVG
jgi:hypothetical protein